MQNSNGGGIGDAIETFRISIDVAKMIFQNGQRIETKLMHLNASAADNALFLMDFFHLQFFVGFQFIFVSIKRLWSAA